MAREGKGASSFDELAIGLSSGTLSRGKALKLVGAALVGGALASIPGIAEAAPKPKPPKSGKKHLGSKCKRASQCASGVCAGGVCGGTEQCTSCPEGCVCALDDSGNITCIACPPGELCQIRLVSSCDDCVAPNVCFRAFGELLGCAPPCTTSG
jgi:hypothetical protein